MYTYTVTDLDIYISERDRDNRSAGAWIPLLLRFESRENRLAFVIAESPSAIATRQRRIAWVTTPTHRKDEMLGLGEKGLGTG